MNTRRLLIVGIVLLFVFPTMFLSFTEGQEPMIGEDDEYHKEAEIETKVSFSWTVYRNATVDYVFRVEVEGDLEGWVKEISPDHFVLDEKEQYRVVRVTLELPSHPERDVTHGDVIFSYREIGSTERNIVTQEISVRAKGVPPVPEANTIVGGYPNPLPEPLDNPYGAFALNMTIWFAVGWIFYFLISPIIHSLTKKTKTDVDEIIIRMLRKPILGLIILYGFVNSLMRLDLAFQVRTAISQLYMLTVVVIGTLIVYRIAIKVLEQITRERGGRHTAFGQVLKPVLEKIFGIIIVIGGLILALNILDIQVTALLAGAGVAGLVIAFAAQDTLGNFFSGMHLLVDRPFSIGEIIMLEDGEYCRVEEIGMRSTKLYNIRDHEGIILPNNAIASQKIVNIAKPDTMIRARIEVGVAYGSDVGKVKDILTEVAEEHPNVINDEEHNINVIFRDFADSSLDFALRVWIDDIPRQWRIMGEIRERIDQRFREEKIEIPFPQRTVWFHDMKKD